jgi:hypothetical protein
MPYVLTAVRELSTMPMIFLGNWYKIGIDEDYEEIGIRFAGARTDCA